LFDDELVKVTADGEIIDDPDCQPAFDSPTTASIEENIATTQVIFIAHAKSRLSFLKPTYSLSGDDAAKFKINAQTGEASFITPPDFEKPEDRDHDNAYRITVTATQGHQKQTIDVTISIVDQAVEFMPITLDDGATPPVGPIVDFNNDGKPGILVFQKDTVWSWGAFFIFVSAPMAGNLVSRRNIARQNLCSPSWLATSTAMEIKISLSIRTFSFYPAGRRHRAVQRGHAI